MNIIANKIQDNKQKTANHIASQFEEKQQPIVEIYTADSIQMYKNDLLKSLESGEISQDDFEKAHKDVSHLEKKIITNKMGHQQTVYVRHHADGKSHDFAAGHEVEFEHKGEKLKGTIKSMKHNDVTDKFGTAIIHDEKGNKYEKSLRGVDHAGMDSKELTTNKESKLPHGVLGKTKSGKAVYENNKKGDHEVYKDFSIEDHQDAANIHNEKSKEYADMFNRQPDIIRRNSGTKGNRTHPLQTKRNTHAQRAIEHGFAIDKLKRESKSTVDRPFKDNSDAYLHKSC